MSRPAPRRFARRRKSVDLEEPRNFERILKELQPPSPLSPIRRNTGQRTHATAKAFASILKELQPPRPLSPIPGHSAQLPHATSANEFDSILSELQPPKPLSPLRRNSTQRQAPNKRFTLQSFICVLRETLSKIPSPIKKKLEEEYEEESAKIEWEREYYMADPFSNKCAIEGKYDADHLELIKRIILKTSENKENYEPNF
ncbi:hypothetical protein CAPTEDRAFT_197370 [Capitella teleta]|uniref:Uncharacterized protein n=1 Tax=Capitella teleta TaxID=283909 RepID=R7TW60_CAPTE|nr:hypothetical protein CAPTEDRAFT_197370 [Capitella teleta]|eukprot:ELT95691.1 hypothetical protein CAPTEDRAFT_197370 [Capitella teleta]